MFPEESVAISLGTPKAPQASVVVANLESVAVVNFSVTLGSSTRILWFAVSSTKISDEGATATSLGPPK